MQRTQDPQQQVQSQSQQQPRARFKVPPFIDIYNSVKNFESKGIIDKTNPLRVAHYEELKTRLEELKTHPDQVKAARIAAGLLSNELILIKSEKFFGWFSPDLHDSTGAAVIGTGSKYYTAIKDALRTAKGQENEGTFGIGERFILQMEAYEDTRINHRHRKSLRKSGKLFLDDLYDGLSLIRDNQQKEIASYLNGEHCLRVLKEDVKRLKEKAQAEHARTKDSYLYACPGASLFTSVHHRVELYRLIGFLAECCDRLYPGDHKPIDENGKENPVYIRAWGIYKSLYALMLPMIAEEYRDSLFSAATRRAEASTEFKLALKRLGKRHYDDIGIDRINEALEKISVFVNELQQSYWYKDQVAAQTWFKQDGLDATLAFLNKWYKHIHEKKEELVIQKTQSSWTGAVVNYGVECALTTAVIEYGIPAATKLVAGSLGPVGWALFMGGSLMATQFGRTAISKGVSAIYAEMLSRLSRTTTNALFGAVTYVFEASREGFKALFDRLDKKDQQYITEWINALLTAPDSIMSRDDKEQLSSISDMPIPTLPEPKPDELPKVKFLAKPSQANAEPEPLPVVDLPRFGGPGRR